MIRFCPILAAAALVLPVPPLAAQQVPVVVELFTSQGCSSCPPADALMHDLAGRDDVLPLSLHVDYWDYIGWKDQFALPGHGKRQKAYAHAAGRDMVYTPQMIVNGKDDVVGAHAMELADLIAAKKAEPQNAGIHAIRDGNDLTVSLTARAGLPAGPFDVIVVRYKPLRRSEITRGENAGRQIDYANVVDEWTPLGAWDGRKPATYTMRLDGDRPAAVLLQARDHGPILAAARVE